MSIPQQGYIIGSISEENNGSCCILESIRLRRVRFKYGKKWIDEDRPGEAMRENIVTMKKTKNRKSEVFR